jgi:F-box interacting protein
MCDNHQSDGRITLANPVTGEILSIPPLPLQYGMFAWFTYKMYGFAYHPTMGRYKVVHVPYFFDRIWVFTLGEASWRAVTTNCPKQTHDRDKGIVGANGTIYWCVKESNTKVMSFDLDNEHITSIGPLPNVLSRPGNWNLTEVHGKLGIAFCHDSPMSDKTEVWVMEHAMEGQLTWSLWYNMQIEKHHLTRPSFTHDGEYILTMRWQSERGYVLYKHKPCNGGQRTHHVVVEIDQRNHETDVADTRTFYMYCETCAYVETTEPLSVYRCW